MPQRVRVGETSLETLPTRWVCIDARKRNCSLGLRCLKLELDNWQLARAICAESRLMTQVKQQIVYAEQDFGSGSGSGWL